MTQQVSRVVETADLLVKDIRDRGLQPGDPYLSTAEAARLLRVSTTLANQALQVLSQRCVVERRQRKGAIIATLPRQPSGEGSAEALARVHVCAPETDERAEGLLHDGILTGLRQELPGAELRLDRIPRTEAGEAIARLVAEVSRAPAPEGFVLLRSSLSAQRMVANSGLPAVVLGSLQPSVRGLPSVDRDNTVTGRVMAEYVLERGATRAVVLMRERQLPGDHPYLESLLASLARGGVAGDDLRLLFLPSDLDAVRDSVSATLQEDPRPVALLCRSEPLAQGALSAAERVGRTLNGDVHLVLSGRFARPGDPPPAYPYVDPVEDAISFGARAGRLLTRHAKGDTTADEHEVAPVTLRLPLGA